MAAKAQLDRLLYSALGPLVLYPATAAGLPFFVMTRRTPRLSYAGMRRLYCVTEGRSNVLFSRLLEHKAERKWGPPQEGVLGHLDAGALTKAVDDLRTKGYHVFATKLPESVCRELRETTRGVLATLVPPPAAGPHRAPFDSRQPLSPRYDYDEEWIAGLPAVQVLLRDPTLHAVAETYLDCTPVNDLIAMWWSASVGRAASSEAAQLYHFDLDRLRFLKMFIYLTDVDAQTGAHCYVEGSHKWKPRGLRRDGRHSDADIVRAYGTDKIKEIGGVAGTIIAADTTGFHKGKPLEQGERLMIQFEFASALFGQSYERVDLRGRADPELVSFMAAHPHTFERFVV